VTWLLLAAAPANAAPLDLATINAVLGVAKSHMSQTLADLGGDTSRFPRADGEAGPWKTIGPDD
jgi:hypothetical protein